jgi:DNA mismatch repair ATPase MutS
MVTTHDVELSQLLQSRYKSYYFQESSNPDKLFDYRIQKGHCSTRNAIMLLEAIGFPPEIIGPARKIASELE